MYLNITCTFFHFSNFKTFWPQPICSPTWHCYADGNDVLKYCGYSLDWLWYDQIALARTTLGWLILTYMLYYIHFQVTSSSGRHMFIECLLFNLNPYKYNYLLTCFTCMLCDLWLGTWLVTTYLASSFILRYHNYPNCSFHARHNVEVTGSTNARL